MLQNVFLMWEGTELVGDCDVRMEIRFARSQSKTTGINNGRRTEAGT